MATVDCDTGADDIDRVTLRSFEDDDTLRSWWQSGSEVTSSLELKDDACTGGTGARKWGFGTVACIREDGLSQVRWTDSRIDLLGVVESTSDDIPALFQWWRENARRLGRADAGSTDASTPEATPKPATPKPRVTPKPTPGKLIRVPGKPRAATCSGAIFRVPDEWDRTWRINKVKVENKSGYERVILQLLRTGKNGGKPRTRALAQRMSSSDVNKAVPSAPRPSVGGISIVVELKGIDDGPRIRRYRPTGVNLVKEISVVGSGNSRTVIVSVPQGTCYQMRIPVWGPNATGKEQRAEVFIDLQSG